MEGGGGGGVVVEISVTSHQRAAADKAFSEEPFFRKGRRGRTREREPFFFRFFQRGSFYSPGI